MIEKHQNQDYDGSNIPLIVGDRYYGQDIGRDFWFHLCRAGLVNKDIAGSAKVICSGGNVSKGTGTDTITISPCVGYAAYSVTIPNSFASLPPTVISADVDSLRISSPQTNNLDVSSTWTNDNATVNYVKLRYLDADGNTRARAKKAGSYPYEKTPSYEFVVDAIAPTVYDIELAKFITVAGEIPSSFDISTRTIRITNLSNQQNINLYRDGFLNLVGTRTSVTEVSYTADVIIMPNGAKILSFSELVDITASGAGGLDTGVEAGTTWYPIHVISNDDGATNALILSLSAASPELPSGYTQSTLKGWVFNDGAGDFVDFNQQDKARIFQEINLVNGLAATTPTAVSMAQVFPDYKLTSRIYGRIGQGSNNVVTTVAPLTSNFGSQLVTSANAGSIFINYSLPLFEGNIYYSNNVGGGSAFVYVSQTDMRI